MPTVYLLHFERPISPSHTTQHYLGYAEKLDDRITKHQQGQGSRLCAVAKERGIEFTIARTWDEGSRQLERQLKLRKAGWRLCPICQQARKNQESQERIKGQDGRV